MVDRYDELPRRVADDLAQWHPDEPPPVDRTHVLAAVGGLDELMLARGERGEAAVLGEDTDVATRPAAAHSGTGASTVSGAPVAVPAPPAPRPR